jgi:hypothetical protein
MRKNPEGLQTRRGLSGTERLEGSRFVAWQLYGLIAGGSRERPEVWQFYGPLLAAARNRRNGQDIALGHSREPPATNP